jgi:hypothetical protein
VLDEPWFTVNDEGESLNVKFAGFTVTSSVVDSVSVPEVPVMVIAADDAKLERGFAVRVSVLVPVVGLGLNDAVTPLGRLEAVRVTEPLKPFWPVTVMIDVAEPPWFMVIEVGEAAMVKLPVPVPVSVMLCDA